MEGGTALICKRENFRESRESYTYLPEWKMQALNAGMTIAGKEVPFAEKVQISWYSDCFSGL